jgi:hypothetical protein
MIGTSWGFFRGLRAAIVSRTDLASRTRSPMLDPLVARDTKPRSARPVSKALRVECPQALPHRPRPRRIRGSGVRPSRRGVFEGAGGHTPGSVKRHPRCSCNVPSAVGGRASQFHGVTTMDNTFTATNRHETRANRYRQLAAQYDARSRDASSPFLCAQFRRTAEEYLVRAIGELRVAEREKQQGAG